MSGSFKTLRHFRRRDHMPIGKVTKIELDSRTIKPIERDLVDGPGALAFVHSGSKMPGRVHMGTVVRANGEKFHGPRFARGQLAGFETWKHGQHPSQRLP